MQNSNKGLKNFSQQIKFNDSCLGFNRQSDKALQMIQYWTPPVPDWLPLKKKPNFNLTIACIIGDHLYRSLRYECNLLSLTPKNWEETLTYAKIDFLLINSFLNSSTGHFHLGQIKSSICYDEMVKIIDFVKKRSIPSIYWITKGHEYHNHFKKFATNFDYVFAADYKELELLLSEGIQAEYLPPCVQPALYNPFRMYDYYSNFSIDNLYDGWADLDRLTDKLEILKDVKKFGLSIIESRYQTFNKRKTLLPDFKDNILGCVTDDARILALKYSKAYLTFENSLSTKTTQQWMALEAAASRLPVVHQGASLFKSVNKIPFILERSNSTDFLLELLRFQKDDLYRERVGHLCWRMVNQEKTFSHHLAKICNKINLNYDWEEYPKASLITPTYRRNLLPRCLETFLNQTYPNKELILVFNGNELPSIEELGLTKQRSDVKILNVPQELFAGACLNIGNSISTGHYCFRIDDDDYYGPNYILDMVLLAKSIDASFFGKPPAPFCFENNQKIYNRKSVYPLSIVPNRRISNGDVWLGGNSISGKKDLFLSTPYRDRAYSIVDSLFLYNIPENKNLVISVMDKFNLVVERRSDQSTHTWKYDSEILKSGSIEGMNFQDMFI